MLLQYSAEERNALYRKVEFKQFGPNTPISIESVETELRKSIERGYCESFADFSPDLLGIAQPLPIGNRRLSVVVAGPEFRMNTKMADVAAIMTSSIKRHCPDPKQLDLIRAALA